MSTYNTNTERLLDAIKTNTANITITADSLSIDTDVLEGKVDGTTSAVLSGLQAMQSAHVATDPGTPILGVRNDDLADLAGADHDYAPIQLTALGAIYTHESNARALVSDNSGENRSSLSNGANTDAITVDIKGRQIVAGGDLENAAATAAPVQIGGRYDSGHRNLGDGDVGGLALNVRGEAKIEGSVDVTSIVPGTAATNLGKAEDAAHTSGDVGVMPLAVRNDALATLGGADGDYAPLQVDATGSLYTNNQFGTFGSILVTGTTAVTCGVADRVFVAIYMLTNTVFNSASGGLVAETEQLYLDDTGAGTSIDADGGAAIDGITFPAGMTLYGRYTGFTLVSGSVVAYVG